MATPRINEIRIDQPSTDNDEYFELVGDENASLAGLTYLVIGDGAGGSGTIEAVIDLSGQTFDSNGLFLAAESTFTLGTADLTTSLNFENSDNVTHLLVEGFTGANGDDLDTNDDGILDVQPFTSIVDSVALIETDPAVSGEQVYSTTQVGPDGTFVPAHVFRDPDGTGDFQIGQFDPVDGDDTPGAFNAPPPRINEVRIDQPGADNDEYFELVGTPGATLDGLTYIVIGDGAGGSGTIEAVIDLSGQTFDSNGFFVAAESTFTLGTADLTASLNFENSDNVTHLLVEGFTGANGDDLDTNDDGILDVQPFTSIVDSVALIETDPAVSGEQVYSTTQVGPDGTFVPAHVFRDPDGTGDFQIGQFDPAGGDDTPGASNDTGGPGPVAATIMEIQGAGHVSPFVLGAGQTVADFFDTLPANTFNITGDTVSTTGIVTAVDSNGFFIQDPTGDGDIATSDAIFVFTSSSPGVNVGDEIQVSGTVSEFFPGDTDSRNLSTTQLLSPVFTVLSSGNALPAAQIIGQNGREAPTENIDDDAFAAFQPTTDGADFFESLEGMLVTAEDLVAVSSTSRFGEIFAVTDQGAGATGFSERGTLNISPDDFNPEKIQIDSDTGILPGFDFPDVDVGALLGDVTGVITYDFGNFQINPTQPFVPVASAIEAEVTLLAGTADQLTIATYNALNLDPNDADGDADVANGRFDAIANQIVNNLLAPDIIGLQEIQDNTGSVSGDGVISASDTLQALVDAIAAAGGPTYSFIDNTFISEGLSGGQPGGNIRTAFLYNDARVDLVPGSVQTIGGQQPGEAFAGARLPLVAEFTFNGQDVTVVNNHFSSKGGSAPIVGIEQPFEARQEDVTVNGSLDERQAQSEAVQEFVDGILFPDPDANVVVLGDLNEFEFVSPVIGLENSGLINLVNTLALDEDERYSFIFQGNSQQLDHILVSDNLMDAGIGSTDPLGGVEFDVVHVNAEFAETDSRASDHDPAIVRLMLAEPAPFAAIYDIQGAGHVSTFAGQEVTTEGVITAIDNDGYYIQDVSGDGDDATSDALFVFTGFGNVPPELAVGNLVSVEGTVREFTANELAFFDNTAASLTTTGISPSSVTVREAAVALPAAVILGSSGRLVPEEFVISPDEEPTDLTDPAQANLNFDPDQDGIDFFESVEGMRVTVEDAVAVSATNRFSETWAVTNQGANLTPDDIRLSNGGVDVGIALAADADGTGDLNPERIQIQTNTALQPNDFNPAPVNNGSLLGDVTGVVGYSFGNYEVQVTEAFTATDSGVTQETTALTGSDDQLTVATYNILNVAGDGSDTAQIAMLADQIINNLGTPDIIGLQEVQDNNGTASATDDGVLSADVTLQAIVDAIAAAGGPQYAFVSAEVDVFGETGGVPGGNIRNAFLYNPDRVSLEEAVTLEVEQLTELGIDDPTTFDGTRDPLLGTFLFNGNEVTVINNHLTSRFGSTPIYGSQQPFVQAGEANREAEVLALNQIVAALLAQDPTANVVVLGDLNTFDFTNDLTEILPGTGDEKILTNLITDRLVDDEAYTFIFQGNSQVLDHVFVTDGLLNRGQAEVDIVHVNNDFATFASDHEPVVTRFTLPEVIAGTDGRDRLFGTDEDDVIAGLGGNDKLFGKDGDDLLLGGEGKDRIFGGDGDDTAYGQEGDDRIFGQDGNDMLFGNEGRDRIFGGDDDDTIRGGGDDDRLFGQRGNDWLFGDEGDDRLYGDRGNDWLFGDSGDDRLDGGRDDDVLDGGEGNDRLQGRSGDDVLIGGEGDDIVDGGSGSDIYVFGLGDGNDIFRDFDLPRGRDDDDDDDDHGGLSFDRIDLVEFGFDEFGDVAALFEDQGRNTVIQFDFETSITLVNVDTKALLAEPQVFILV